MKRFAAVLGLLVASLSASAAYAQGDGSGYALPTPLNIEYTQQSAGGSAQCGDLVIDEVSHMTKGRTDGMVLRVDHRVGCAHLVMHNLVGTGTDEGYGYAGQEATCQRYGKQDAVSTFRYYFGVTVHPDDIKVACSRYSGAD